MNNFHTPVLLKEIIENLRVEKGKKYIDATVGGGGHTFEILRLGGEVLGIDVDKEAIEYTSGRWRIESRKRKIEERNLTLVRGNFREIDKIAQEKGFEKVNGIIFDLGVSSHQIGSAERGFSFQKEGPLDMRMDQDLAVRASDLVKILTKGELYELFTKFGEESRAGELSRRIVSARRVKPIETTRDLVGIVGYNFAAKIFQALRIAVNDELDSLREALQKSLTVVEKGGHILVISFHSLEDRIVKRTFLEFEKSGKGSVITKKPIVPNPEELVKNRRARSAKLRVF